MTWLRRFCEWRGYRRYMATAGRKSTPAEMDALEARMDHRYERGADPRAEGAVFETIQEHCRRTGHVVTQRLNAPTTCKAGDFVDPITLLKRKR